MTQSNSSDRLSKFRSVSGIVKAQQRHQQLACDRCRGQKLRCIRTSNLHASCERCEKADATCVTDSSVRMGRPQRTDKERRETRDSSRKSQPIHSSKVEDIPEVQILNDSSSIPYKSFEKVSNLNTYRRLSIIGPMAKESRNTELSLVKAPDKNKILSDVIIFMIQGLQKFHELLLEILRSTNQNFCTKTTTTHVAMYNSQKSHPPLQHTFWQNTKPCSTSLLSPSDIRDTDLAESISGPNNKVQKVPRSDSSSVSHIQDGPSSITLLDMFTSLLIISCYINLIHLCRDVFAVIRSALPASGHQTNLLTLSGFQISGVSIDQNSDLQITVLAQVVVRLVDRIELSLGHPYNSTAESGKKDQVKLCSKAILPQLLDVLLRQEEIEGQRSCKGGIEALREEIRKLNEVVHKPI